MNEYKRISRLSNSGTQDVSISNPLSEFGEVLTANLHPSILISYPDIVNSRVVSKRSNQSGGVTHSVNYANLSTGAAANSSAEILSKSIARYVPGQGVIARFTSIFTAGASNSTQLIGVGGDGNGYYFGYNGTSFGVLRRTSGTPEVRTLTVTTASSNAENITITLDGDAKNDVTVTNSGVITTTVNEIAAADYSDVGRGWDTYAVGDAVLFVSWDSSSRTGTYSLSGATSAVGTFAQNIAGVSPTDTWVAQSSWNGDDKFDGSGSSGVTLDFTKLNVYQIGYQWLGGGSITFYVENPNTGLFEVVHKIYFANSSTSTSTRTPSMKFNSIVENTSNTSDIVLKTPSAGIFTEGITVIDGIRFGISGEVDLSGTSSETPILSIRNKVHSNSIMNYINSKIIILSTSCEHSKPCSVNMYLNPTLTGASFSDLDASTSLLETDTSATALTGGIYLFGLDLGKTGNEVVYFDQDEHAGVIRPGDVITFTLAPKSVNGAEGNIKVNISELH